MIISTYINKFFFISILAPSSTLSINILKTEEDINEKIRELQETEKRLVDIIERQRTNEQSQTNIQHKLLDFINELAAE